ncbi:ketopantoate reductase family protein [Neobacillus niacini]|uniref:ketopantoate reductase family protein n=1 Tax=Neobacillus niacini TaxID=86668 RepID=UPI0021CAE670|nr:2-dehydropantoate 2-reductase [Neobacillus niacini]MCM3764330.1 2-dehydropantoate 2-reductase [Neobacillus niacini]
MKIGVAGTGAVGGYYGGFLKRAGNEVIFFARGTNLRRMQEKGLTIEAGEDSFTVTEQFTDRYQDFSDVDLLIFAVKATATAEVAANLHPFLKETCLVLTLQNGVDNEEILAEVFGKDRVLSAAAYISAHITAAGVVKQIGYPPKLVIGALDSSMTTKAAEIAELLNAAEIEAFPTRDILKIKWKKLIWNVTFNPLTALMEVKVGAIYEDEGLKRTAVEICQEAIAVANAAGIELDDDYDETIMAQGKMAKDHHTSMLQDKQKSKPLELESICGYIVKKGNALKVETPVLETVYHLLNYQTR